MVRDPTFGLTLTIGAGGVLVELMNDSVSLLLPAGREEIAAAINQLKVARLIGGYRAGAAGDFDSVVAAVEAVARYALDHNANLVELDVNPLCVTADGAIAVDAFIRKSL